MATLAVLRTLKTRWSSIVSRLTEAVMPQSEAIEDLGKKNTDGDKGYYSAQTHYSQDAFEFASPRIIRYVLKTENAVYDKAAVTAARTSPAAFVNYLVNVLALPDKPVQEYCMLLATLIQISPGTGNENDMDEQIRRSGQNPSMDFKFFYTPKAIMRGSGEGLPKEILALIAPGVIEFPSVQVAAPVVPEPVLVRRAPKTPTSRVFEDYDFSDLETTVPTITLSIADPTAGVTADEVKAFYDAHNFKDLAAARKFITDKGLTIANTANRAAIEAVITTNADKFTV